MRKQYIGEKQVSLNPRNEENSIRAIGQTLGIANNLQYHEKKIGRPIKTNAIDDRIIVRDVMKNLKISPMQV